MWYVDCERLRATLSFILTWALTLLNGGICLSGYHTLLPLSVSAFNRFFNICYCQNFKWFMGLWWYPCLCFGMVWIWIMGLKPFFASPRTTRIRSKSPTINMDVDILFDNKAFVCCYSWEYRDWLVINFRFSLWEFRSFCAHEWFKGQVFHNCNSVNFVGVRSRSSSIVAHVQSNMYIQAPG